MKVHFSPHEQQPSENRIGSSATPVVPEPPRDVTPIERLREVFRSMEPMRKEDDLEDQLLTDDEPSLQRFRESVCTDQWVKIVTEHHNAGADEDGNMSLSGWFPVEIASLLFSAQFCDDPSFDQQLWDYAQEGPFSKWELRSKWYIAEVLPSGLSPPKKGWIQ
jgi:hypothetical protein